MPRSRNADSRPDGITVAFRASSLVPASDRRPGCHHPDLRWCAERRHDHVKLAVVIEVPNAEPRWRAAVGRQSPPPRQRGPSPMARLRKTCSAGPSMVIGHRRRCHIARLTRAFSRRYPSLRCRTIRHRRQSQVIPLSDVISTNSPLPMFWNNGKLRRPARASLGPGGRRC